MYEHKKYFPHSWSHRLTVRTPGFHPGNRSSILLEITNKNDSSKDGSFLLVSSRSEPRTTEFEDKRRAQEFIPSMPRRRKPKGLSLLNPICYYKQMNILLLNGSPAKPSHTSATLRVLAGFFEEDGHECDTLDLADYNLPVNNPVYHADAMQSTNQVVKDFATRVKRANIVVLGTPLYHGSFSGLLKSSLDNLDGDAFYNKKVILVANASGARASMQAAQHLVVVPRTMGGLVYNRLIGTCKADFEVNEGVYQLVSEEIISRCKTIVGSDLATS